MAKRLAPLLLLAAVACVPQSEECARYVECQAAYDEALGVATEQGGVDTSRWDNGGACWSDLPTAADCTADCVEATDALRAAGQSAGVDLPECESG
jgi:hypothetical protein